MIELKTGIKFELITGKFITYSHLIADDGYCFYDKTVSENERIYHTQIKTPITDVLVLKDQYESVLGSADVLNQELAEKIKPEVVGEEI